MARQLTEQGYIQFTPTLRHGRPILNEVFWIQPLTVLGDITAPTLVVHGTKDTFVPIEASRAAMTIFTAPHELAEIEGSQHGFAVHDDPQYVSPQSQEWQAFVTRIMEVLRTLAPWSARSVSQAPTGHRSQSANDLVARMRKSDMRGRQSQQRAAASSCG